MKYSIIEHGVVYESDNLFGFAAWPTVAKAKDGTLLAAFSAYRMSHVCPFGKTSLCKSTDGGKTWSAPTPIIDTELDDRDGGLCVFGDKVMLTSFNNTTAFQMSGVKPDTEDKKKLLVAAHNACFDAEKAEKLLGSTYKISNDNGNTFGELGILPLTSPHGPCQLQDGRLFYVGRAFSSPESNWGINYHKPNLHKKFGDYDALIEGIYYTFSDDDGETWSKPQELQGLEKIWDEGRFCCEPHAIQLKSGRILVHIRVEKYGQLFAIYQCYSDDNGKTFTAPTLLIEKGSPPHLMQLESGRVICSYGYRSEPFGQRARYSDDDGNTWSEEIILRDDGPSSDLGYPSTVELSDGSLLTVYYQRKVKDENAGVYYTKWKLER